MSPKLTKRNNTPVGEMTAAEFNEALEELGLTWPLAQEHLGIARRTIGHYAAGDSPVPAPVARLLKLWLAIAEGKPVDLPFAATMDCLTVAQYERYEGRHTGPIYYNESVKLNGDLDKRGLHYTAALRGRELVDARGVVRSFKTPLAAEAAIVAAREA